MPHWYIWEIFVCV